MLKAIFGVFKSNAVKIQEYKASINAKLKNIEMRKKDIHRHLGIEPPCSPVVYEDESETKVFEDPWAWYDTAQTAVEGARPSHEAAQSSEEEEEESNRDEDYEEDND